MPAVTSEMQVRGLPPRSPAQRLPDHRLDVLNGDRRLDSDPVVNGADPLQVGNRALGVLALGVRLDGTFQRHDGRRHRRVDPLVWHERIPLQRVPNDPGDLEIAGNDRFGGRDFELIRDVVDAHHPVSRFGRGVLRTAQFSTTLLRSTIPSVTCTPICVWPMRPSHTSSRRTSSRRSESDFVMAVSRARREPAGSLEPVERFAAESRTSCGDWSGPGKICAINGTTPFASEGNTGSRRWHVC